MGEIKYEKIETDNKLVFRRVFLGEITIEEIMESFRIIVEKEYDPYKNKKIYMVTDVTEAKLNIKMADFKRLLSFIKENPVYSSIKMAVIVNSPKKTVFPTLASTVVGINVKPFSTVEAAIKWAQAD